MVTIGTLVRAALGPEHVNDRRLPWGARASAYEAEIRASLDRGLVPVLVELAYDLPPDIPRKTLIEVDHHGERAGGAQPSSLRQVFDLLQLPPTAWTREHDLITANDVGHMAGMRAIGASADDIRRVRDADRRAQGVTARDERLARAALRRAKRRGALLILQTGTTRTSPALDFLEPEYGGSGSGDVLVMTPAAVEFYGAGTIVDALAQEYPQSWKGGALPLRGYWGLAGNDMHKRRRVMRRVAIRYTQLAR